MKLERLERDLKEDSAFSVWKSPDGKGTIEAPMSWADYVASGKDDGQPPQRPASVPSDYLLDCWKCRTKYTNGQDIGNLKPGQMGENTGWAKGSGPSFPNPQREVRSLRVIAPDSGDQTKMETWFEIAPDYYTKNEQGEISGTEDIVVRDGGKGKQFTYQLSKNTLTKLKEDPL